MHKTKDSHDFIPKIGFFTNTVKYSTIQYNTVIYDTNTIFYIQFPDFPKTPNTQDFAKDWSPNTGVLSAWKAAGGSALKLSDSNHKTFHPWAEASVVVCTVASSLENDHFYAKSSLVCVVLECQCFPTNTCLQCPNCVSIQNGHFYSPRLISALALESSTLVEKTSRSGQKSP